MFPTTSRTPRLHKALPRSVSEGIGTIGVWRRRAKASRLRPFVLRVKRRRPRAPAARMCRAQASVGHPWEFRRIRVKPGAPEGVGDPPAVVGNQESRPKPELPVAASRHEAEWAGQGLVVSFSAVNPRWVKAPVDCEREQWRRSSRPPRRWGRGRLRTPGRHGQKHRAVSGQVRPSGPLHR